MDKRAKYLDSSLTRESLLNDMQEIRKKFFWVTVHPFLRDERNEFKKLLDDLERSVQCLKDVLFIQDFYNNFNIESPTPDSPPSPSSS